MVSVDWLWQVTVKKHQWPLPGSRVTSVLFSVVVQSLKDAPPLTDGSILFSSDRVALAKVGQQ